MPLWIAPRLSALEETLSAGSYFVIRNCFNAFIASQGSKQAFKQSRTGKSPERELL
jgi:hypothetical protein